MLALLSGRTHRVHTGVTVGRDSSLETIAVSTAVTFVTFDAATIDWYVGTGEPMDKAGGYAMQGAGGALVERIDGSVSNVIGLPLAETLELISTLRSRLPTPLDGVVLALEPGECQLARSRQSM